MQCGPQTVGDSLFLHDAVPAKNKPEIPNVDRDLQGGTGEAFHTERLVAHARPNLDAVQPEGKSAPVQRKSCRLWIAEADGRMAES